MRVDPVCPDHGLMVRQNTQWGVRFYCPYVGCTVVCWDRRTSRPGNAETRAARERCHAAFDILWMAEKSSPFRFDERGIAVARGHRRALAYAWLSKALGIPIDDAHVGMFDLATCERAMMEIAELKRRTREMG